MSDLLEMIKRHEGTGPQDEYGNFLPYNDSEGYLTIGYGINIDQAGIRPHEADMLLELRVAEVEREMATAFTWFRDLDSVRRSALTDMAYNLGLPRFQGFKKTISAIERRDWDEAAREMLDSRWALQVGNRARELSEMVRTGEWVSHG